MEVFGRLQVNVNSDWTLTLFNFAFFIDYEALFMAFFENIMDQDSIRENFTHIITSFNLCLSTDKMFY